MASKHYQKRTVIDLTPDKQPDLEKIISNEIESVANQISFRANWFTTDAYLALWKKYFSEFLNEYVKIQEVLDTFKTNFPDDPHEQFSLMIDSLSKLSLVLKTSYDEWHRKSMAEFLDSNLPLELYSLYNLSYIEKISVMRSLASDLTKLQNRLYLVRANNIKIKNELSKYERQHKNLSEILTKTSRSELTLGFYLKSNSATEMKDLFRSIPLTLESSSEEKFRIHLNIFRKNLFELTNFLDKKYLSEDIVLNSSKSESFKDFEEKLNQIILET